MAMPTPLPPWATPAQPTPLPDARWLLFNPSLGAQLGLNAAWQQQPQALALLAGNAAWPGYRASASVYGGHQFGRWVAQLGDGRAHLIAELSSAAGVQQLQLKGAGPTVYARGGDGRAVWRSSLREYLACEALHALGVPSTRALSLITSEQTVWRDGAPERIAVLARVAPSFIRFGHFEYFGAQIQAAKTPAAAAPALAALRQLAAHVIGRHFGHLPGAEALGAQELHASASAGAPAAAPSPALVAAWLHEVVQRTAQLVAQWQTLGFTHGVMNTDNFSILGLTLDYGPFGFMDRFRAHHIANSSDHEGRYAWTAQPSAGQWNCARLLAACQPLLEPGTDAAQALATQLEADYASAYHHAVMARWRAKLGLLQAQATDAALLNQLLTLMQASRADFSLTWRALSAGPTLNLRQRFAEPAAFDAWAAQWQARLAQEGQAPADAAATAARQRRMQAANPLFVLRNHLAQAVIERTEAGDASALQEFLRVLARPFTAQPGMQAWATPPNAQQAALEVSCSA